MKKRILIVHPHDKSTSFLERIKNHLICQLPNDVHYFNIKPNEISHQQCLEKISEHPSEGIVLFLGHGRSDRLFGSKGDLYENIEFVSEDAREANPEKYYFNDNFINETNSQIFKGKKVVCLACKSNEVIALSALNNNAISFLGFGDIPTSAAEFRKNGEENFTSSLVATMKAEVCYIIKTSLVYSINNGHSFGDFLNTIKFITNQRIGFFRINAKWFRDRHLLADYLYFFKREALLLGDKKVRIL